MEMLQRPHHLAQQNTTPTAAAAHTGAGPPGPDLSPSHELHHFDEHVMDEAVGGTTAPPPPSTSAHQPLTTARPPPFVPTAALTNNYGSATLGQEYVTNSANNAGSTSASNFGVANLNAQQVHHVLNNMQQAQQTEFTTAMREMVTAREYADATANLATGANGGAICIEINGCCLQFLLLRHDDLSVGVLVSSFIALAVRDAALTLSRSSLQEINL